MQLRLAPQHAHAERVERHDPHGARRRADELGEALAHLAGRLVREGDRQDPYAEARRGRRRGARRGT